MEEIIPQFTGFDGVSAFDYSLNDIDVMGVYLMSIGDPNNLLPFDTNKGIPNQGFGLPNYKQPNQKINLTTGLAKPQQYQTPVFTKHNFSEIPVQNIPTGKKHLPNIHKAKYNPKTGQVEPKNSKQIKKSINKQSINDYLDRKEGKIKTKKSTKTPKKNKSYNIGNATISRTSKHKSKWDRVQQLVNKYK